MTVFKPIRVLVSAFLLMGLAQFCLASDFIALEEIHRGMKGYGLTVFAGTTIDTFGVEVIGVQAKSRVDGSLIIIEVSGHGLEQSSIAQGMSGSPIYIEGRFAGALAFGWSGALRPIAGVTPAQDILGLPVEPDVYGASQVHAPISDHQNMQGLMGERQDDQGLEAALFGTSIQHPQAAGFMNNMEAWPASEELILDLLQEATNGRGFELPSQDHWFYSPVGTVISSSGGQRGKGPALEPGSACAVPLVTGDAMLGVTGTVTWTSGDDVLMMGHPFMQRGPVDLPLATAEILTIFPSRQMSFKMGYMGDIVGSVHHDQRAGLSGKLGPSPQMIPVTVEVELPVPGSRVETVNRQYDFQVVEDPLLTPSLVFWTLYNSILAEGDDASTQNIAYELTSHWDGLDDKPMVIRGKAAGPSGAVGLASDWMVPFSLLLDNPFERVKLKSVHARLEMTRPMATANIVGLNGPRSLVAGQESITVQVEVSPRQGASEIVEVVLDLPATLKEGPYRLVAASAAELFTLETTRAAGRFQVASLSGALEILRMDRSRDGLVVALLSPGNSLVIADREMNHLPGSVASVLKKGNMQIESTMADYAARSSQIVPYVLSGHSVRKLRVLAAPETVREEQRP